MGCSHAKVRGPTSLSSLPVVASADTSNLAPSTQSTLESPYSLLPAIEANASAKVVADDITEGYSPQGQSGAHDEELKVHALFYNDDTDWLDLSSRESSYKLDARAHSEEYTHCEQEVIAWEPQSKSIEPIISKPLKEGRLIVRGVRSGRPLKTRYALTKSSKNNDDILCAIAEIGSASDDQKQSLQSSSRTASHSSHYYSSLKGGVPLRFKQTIFKPMSGFGWTCRPKMSPSVPTSSFNNSNQSSIRTFLRPLSFEVQKVSQEGTVLSSVVLSGAAARFVRSVTGCGTVGAIAAVEASTGGWFSVSKAQNLFQNVGAQRFPNKKIKQRISLLR